jgi:hypothetical protein
MASMFVVGHELFVEPANEIKIDEQQNEEKEMPIPAE